MVLNIVSVSMSPPVSKLQILLQSWRQKECKSQGMGVWMRSCWWEQKVSHHGTTEGKCVGKDKQNQGASLGRARNLEKWKITGIYKVDPRWLWAMGNVEPEATISCNMKKLPMEGWGHQPSHKIFDPQFVLFTQCEGGIDGAEIKEWPTTDWPNRRPMPWESPPLTQLMLLCYTCR